MSTLSRTLRGHNPSRRPHPQASGRKAVDAVTPGKPLGAVIEALSQPGAKKESSAPPQGRARWILSEAAGAS